MLMLVVVVRSFELFSFVTHNSKMKFTHCENAVDFVMKLFEEESFNLPSHLN